MSDIGHVQLTVQDPLLLAQTREHASRPERSKHLLRMSLYCQLLALDVVAFLLSPVASWLIFSRPLGARGDYYSAAAMLSVYLVIAAIRETYSLASLSRFIDSARRSMTSLALAIFLVVLVVFLIDPQRITSRLDLMLTALWSGVFMLVGRALFSRRIRRVSGGILVNRLLILDGRELRYPAEHSVILDAQKIGLRPSLNDPQMLTWFGTLATAYDRVIVDCVPERRKKWAALLKGANIDGEILLDEANEVGAIGMRTFHGVDSLLVARRPLSIPDRMQKRLLDLAITVPLLMALLPFFTLIALAVKFDSPGPILFRQDRIGRGNRLFKVLKFRSMRDEASDRSGARSASRQDDRVTRVGRFIRATSIDELPQLFNVLLGDMSLVGPRPHALGSLAGDRLFWEVDETYWHRHQLKPGITGLAQVRGFRGATHKTSDLTDRLQSDMEYIQGWDIWRDLAILINTARVVIHRNAF